MTATIEAVIGQNITLVYDTLDLQNIDRNKIRQVISSVPPTVMDTPEMIVAIYPPNPWIIQIGDHRVRINIGSELDNLGDIPIWEYALKAAEIVPSERSSLIAYGYNFDFGVRFQNITPNAVLIERFLPDRQSLEDILQGELISYLPRLIFKSQDEQYDIIFEPMNNTQMRVHGNVHFRYINIRLPSLDDLKVSYIAHYERIRGLVTKLLNN